MGLWGLGLGANKLASENSRRERERVDERSSSTVDNINKVIEAVVLYIL